MFVKRAVYWPFAFVRRTLPWERYACLHMQIVNHLAGGEKNVKEMLEKNPYLTMQCSVSFK